MLTVIAALASVLGSAIADEVKTQRAIKANKANATRWMLEHERLEREYERTMNEAIERHRRLNAELFPDEQDQANQIVK